MASYNINYRVYYEDTDAGGIVYHANYLKFAERARTEWLRTLGIEQSKLMKEEGVLLPIYHLEIRFVAPAALDDLLTIETQLIEFERTRMKIKQRICCETKELALLDVSVACVNLAKKPTRWPQKMQQQLNSIL